MSKPLHVQHTIPATASAVFDALTDPTALQAWFAEHAAVSLDDKQYDFWGRFTPEAPARDDGRHRIELVELNRRLRYAWHFRRGDTTVDLRLKERDGQTVIGVWHHDIPGVKQGEPGWYGMQDVWYLWLENLRRYLAGRPVVRCDFASIGGGDVVRTVEIDGPAADVWDALVNPEQRNRWITNDATEEPRVGAAWVDWGEHAGALEVLAIEPGKKLQLGWEIAGSPTVVTWTLEESGGKTRLTLAHSGFAPEYRTDGELLGWLGYLVQVQSLVEFGLSWLPPVAEYAQDAALYYAAAVWGQKEGLLRNVEDEWE